VSVPCDPATFVSLQICQHRARRRRSHTFLGGISHNCPFGYANCEFVSHSPRAGLARAENSTCGRRGDALGWGRVPHEKSMLPTHIPSCLFPYQIENAPVAVVCCAVGLIWTIAAKVILNKSCQYSGVGLQIGKGRARGATHRENGMGRRMSEITKVAPWPRLPEGTVADHPHQCRAWTGPGMRCRCRVCIRTLSVCAELSCTHIRALRVQGRSRQRRPAGRAGAKRLLAAVHGSAVSALGA